MEIQEQGFASLTAMTSENPYNSGRVVSSRSPKTRATRWLIWLGVATIAFGVASVYVVIQTAVNRVSGEAVQPKPADLADGMYLVQLAHLAVLPLFVLGAMLLIAGFLIRKPREDK